MTLRGGGEAGAEGGCCGATASERALLQRHSKWMAFCTRRRRRGRNLLRASTAAPGACARAAGRRRAPGRELALAWAAAVRRSISGTTGGAHTRARLFAVAKAPKRRRPTSCAESRRASEQTNERARDQLIECGAPVRAAESDPQCFHLTDILSATFAAGQRATALDLGAQQ